MSDNEIYLLIKYIKSVLWRVVKRLSYIEDTRCLNVNVDWNLFQYLQLDTSYKRSDKFKPHQCGPRCLNETQDNRNRLKGQSPLIIPMLCRWER